MERIYAVLEVRSTDDEKREFEGVANSAALDDHGTIIEPLGARFALPLPLLFHHDQSTPVGEITAARLVDGKWHVKGHIRQVGEPGFVKDITDRAWHNVKYQLMRGLSIGFKPLKQQGNRFIEWAWRELSIVTIPSNTEASIFAVRSAFAASGEPANQPGVSGNHTKPRRSMTNAERITALENRRAANVARMEELTQKASDEGRTKDQAEQEEFDTLREETRSVDRELVDVREMATLSVAKATPVNGSTPAAASQSRSGAAVVTVKSRAEPGILMARHVMALAANGGNKGDAADYAKRVWGDGADDVAFGIRHGIAALQTRTAVAPGTTAQATFAAPLVQTNYASDFLEMLRPKTLLGKIPGIRHVPFNTSMPAQTAGGTFKWVGQGKMKPVTNAQYAAVTLGFAKASGIIVLTEELVKLSTPSAETAVKDSMVKDCVNFLDVQFIDASVAAVSNVNPASITNGVTGTAASGTDVADARSDIAARIAAFSAANYNLDELVILMSQAMAFNLGTMINSVGSPAFPGLGINGGSILGIPVVTSGNVGAQIVFAHAPSILMADEGGIEIDVSREASVELNDTPTEPSDATTVLTSLWQANLVGIRVERMITWGKARATAVDRITTAAYVP